MASQVEIINVALSRIGANEITSLTEGTTEQKVAVNLWDVARQATLRDHPWNFAISEVELAQLSSTTSYNFEYSYQLPADCLRLIAVYDNVNFKVFGRKIYTDSNSCWIKYVKDVKDVNTWDTLFIDVMAQRLAAEMAYTLTKSQAVADTNYNLYERKIAKARFVDSTEDIQDEIGQGESSIISARF